MSHNSDIVDLFNDVMDRAQTRLNETCHARNNALLRQSLKDWSTQDIKDNSEFASSLHAGKHDLAEDKKSLAAVVIAHIWEPSGDVDGELSAPLEDLTAVFDEIAISLVCVKTHTS